MVGTALALLFLGYAILNIKRLDKILFLDFYFILFSQFIIFVLGAPTSVIYLCDFINCIILLNIIKEKRIIKISKDILNILIILLLFFLVGICVAIINGVSILLIIWSIRNLGRFVVFSIGIVKYWNPVYTKKLINSFYPILIINFFVSVIQYLKFPNSSDFIGGIFGYYFGVNAYSVIFFMITCAYYVDAYIKKEFKFIKLLIVLGSVFSCVIFADLKVFYFIFVFECIIIMIQNKLGLKTIIFFMVGILLTLFVYYICLSIYNSRNIFDIDYIIYYLTESSYTYDLNSINRTDGIPIINRLLNFSNYEKWFGLGLGAGEYNSYFKSYIYTYLINTHYYWFLYSWLYLEMGYTGLSISVLLVILLCRFFNKYKKIIYDKKIINVSIVLCFLFPVIAIYNVSLRIECGYIYFTIIAIAIKQISDQLKVDNC